MIKFNLFVVPNFSLRLLWSGSSLQSFFSRVRLLVCVDFWPFFSLFFMTKWLCCGKKSPKFCEEDRFWRCMQKKVRFCKVCFCSFREPLPNFNLRCVVFCFEKILFYLADAMMAGKLHSFILFFHGFLPFFKPFYSKKPLHAHFFCVLKIFILWRFAW